MPPDCPDCRQLREALERIVTGSGAQTENLDAEFMRESLGQMPGDDVEMTVEKTVLLDVVALLAATTQEPKEKP